MPSFIFHASVSIAGLADVDASLAKLVPGGGVTYRTGEMEQVLRSLEAALPRYLGVIGLLRHTLYLE